jgi:hypothetical protein
VHASLARPVKALCPVTRQSQCIKEGAYQGIVCDPANSTRDDNRIFQCSSLSFFAILWPRLAGSGINTEHRAYG